MADWAKDKQDVWAQVCEKYGGSKEAFDCGTWGFFDWSIGKAWPTVSSINKARKFGWTRHDDTFETWVETFRTFANAGILPRAEVIRSMPIDTKLSATNGNINGMNGSLIDSETSETKGPPTDVGAGEINGLNYQEGDFKAKATPVAQVETMSS